MWDSCLNWRLSQKWFAVLLDSLLHESSHKPSEWRLSDILFVGQMVCHVRIQLWLRNVYIQWWLPNNNWWEHFTLHSDTLRSRTNCQCCLRQCLWSWQYFRYILFDQLLPSSKLDYCWSLISEDTWCLCLCWWPTRIFCALVAGYYLLQWRLIWAQFCIGTLHALGRISKHIQRLQSVLLHCSRNLHCL